MNAYRYKAMDKNGRMNNGKVDAENTADLEMRLSKLNLELVNYKKLKSTGKLAVSSGVKRRDLITFCFHLEQTTRAGVPMLESLRDLRDSSDNPKMAIVSNAMIQAIEGGKTLSEAMDEFPHIFGKIFISIVRAGEQSGEMSNIFKELGASLKWQDEQAALTKKLLTYPAFVSVVVGAAVFFLMTYLVPELLRFVKTLGQEVPAHTKALVFVSDIFVAYWYVILLVPIVTVLLLYFGIKTSANIRFKYDKYQLKMPVIGIILEKIILTRLCSFFAIMYSSGITIIDCMKIGEDIVGNKFIAKSVNNIGQQITDGTGLSDSFEKEALFPPLVLRMIRVGENTGALETALTNISYFYIRDVKESIERLQAMIEPTMTIILGAIIGWVMLSVLGPIYDIVTKIDF